jgi:formate dehydrogenase major subunit
MENSLMNSVTLYIDDKLITADKNKTIMEAALENDIYIPHLCYHPELKPKSACRLCMVEVNGNSPVLSCQTRVEAGMKVSTRSPAVDRLVLPIVELVIVDHHTSCSGCPGNKKCELQKIMAHFHIDRKRLQRLRPPAAAKPTEALNSFLNYDPNRCVRCGICLQTCEDLSGRGYLYFVDRGYSTQIAFYGDESICATCLKCIPGCPVGALLPWQ